MHSRLTVDRNISIFDRFVFEMLEGRMLDQAYEPGALEYVYSFTAIVHSFVSNIIVSVRSPICVFIDLIGALSTYTALCADTRHSHGTGRTTDRRND